MIASSNADHPRPRSLRFHDEDGYSGPRGNLVEPPDTLVVKFAGGHRTGVLGIEVHYPYISDS